MKVVGLGRNVEVEAVSVLIGEAEFFPSFGQPELPAVNHHDAEPGAVRLCALPDLLVDLVEFRG